MGRIPDPAFPDFVAALGLQILITLPFFESFTVGDPHTPLYESCFLQFCFYLSVEIPCRIDELRLNWLLWSKEAREPK